MCHCDAAAYSHWELYHEDSNGATLIPWTHEIPEHEERRELDRKGEVRITLTGLMGRIDRRMAPWP
jgi:hypothetical protein